MESGGYPSIDDSRQGSRPLNLLRRGGRWWNDWTRRCRRLFGGGRPGHRRRWRASGHYGTTCNQSCAKGPA